MKWLILLLVISPASWAAAAPPRSEFPQPQFERASWLTLNGDWQFEFDDKNAGLDANWGASLKPLSRHITVPYCFESRLSGIGDTSFHPWVWYRREISMPAEWAGKRVLLHFGAVDYRSIVWVNGQEVGRHEGGNTPFQFDITPLLKSGGNVITVRAEDPPTDRSIPRGKQYWEPKSAAIFYTRTSGVWQPVWLEATGESYLQRVRITPSNDGTVRFEAVALREQPDLEFRTIVSGAGEVSAKIDNGRAVALLQIATPRLWSVQHPELYDVSFELRRAGTVVDSVKSYFGFRSVSAEGGRVRINDQPSYLKLILDQGYWPESILTPPSDEAIRYDIRMTKEMGFNGVRKHQKLEDPRYLYWADRMGLLVSSEIANAYIFDESYLDRFTREWREAVERDYNHPSIIIWVPINESWGVPDLTHQVRQQDHLKANYWLTHSLDSTRLVIDNDGWEHTGFTDLFAIHDYTPRGELLEARYKDMGFPAKSVPDNAKRVLIPGYQYNGSPVYLSEFGGIAFIAPGSNVPPEAWGYSGVEKSVPDALERLRGIYQAIHNTPAIVGICYTQLTDVEQEINGLMTYDRKPKFDVTAVRRINEMLR